MNNKKILSLIILLNVLFLIFNIYYFVKPKELNSVNSVKQETNNVNKDFKLQDLMNYLNSGTDKALMSNEFGLIKLAADPLYELTEYEGCDNTGNKILCVSYGINGTYKVNDNASVEITIIKDNTINNGNYIFTKVEPSYETSFFKVNNTYLIFETFLNANLDNNKINENMINVINFEQKFYNYYSNYLNNLGL